MFPAFKPLPKVHDYTLLFTRNGRAPYILGCVAEIVTANGWKCFEAPGVEPVFLYQDQAIDYAIGRVCFRSGEIRVLDSNDAAARIIPFNNDK